MSTTEIVYVVCDANGEYVKDAKRDTADSPCRTEASDEAQEFENSFEAQAACRRKTDQVLSRQII